MHRKLHVLAVLAIGLGNQSANATLLSCGGRDGFSVHPVVGGYIETRCHEDIIQYDLTPGKRSYSLNIVGVGPGVSFGIQEFEVACVGPVEGFYLGASFTAAAIYGVTGGLYVGLLGGACVVGGLQYEVGINAKLGVLRIKKRANSYQEYGPSIPEGQDSALLRGLDYSESSGKTKHLVFYYKERDLNGGEEVKRVSIVTVLINGQLVYKTQLERKDGNEWQTVAAATRPDIKSLHEFLQSLKPFENKVLLEQAGKEWEQTFKDFTTY